MFRWDSGLVQSPYFSWDSWWPSRLDSLCVKEDGVLLLLDGLEIPNFGLRYEGTREQCW